MLSRIIRPFNYNVRESEFHLNDTNNCPRSHLCKHVTSLFWECDKSRLTVFSWTAINWHWQCLIDSYYITLTPTTDCNWMHTITKISDTNLTDSALDIAHRVTSHHHIVTDNWQWQSSTDTGNWQCLTAPSYILTWPWLYWEIRQTFLSRLNFLCFKHIQLIRLAVGWLKLTIHWKWSNQFQNLNKLL